MSMYWKLILVLLFGLFFGWLIAENSSTKVELYFFGFSTYEIPLVIVLLSGMVVGSLLTIPGAIRIYFHQKRKYQSSSSPAEVDFDRPSVKFEPADLQKK